MPMDCPPANQAAFLFARSWPDSLDLVLVFIFLASVLALPLLGHWLMIIDVRAYLRALKGALVVVTRQLDDITPDWVTRRCPEFLNVLDLDETCSEEDIKQAYRRLAEKLHPDRGGDPLRFHLLQKQVDKALRFVRKRNG